MNSAKMINEHFSFEISDKDQVFHVKLIGIIDENSDFSSLLNLKNSPVVFTSRKLLRLIHAASGLGLTLLRSSIIALLNLVIARP